MKRLWWFLLLVVSTEVFGGEWNTHYLFHENNRRHFRVFSPDKVGEAAPAVLLIHDRDENAKEIFSEGFDGMGMWPEVASKYGFYLVVPAGTHPRTGKGTGKGLTWNDCRAETKLKFRRAEADDVAFIDKVMEKALKDYPIDGRRVFGSGRGIGGLMLQRYTHESRYPLAALSLFSVTEVRNRDCGRMRSPMPVMAVNATDDPVFPWSGGFIRGKLGDVLSVNRFRRNWESLNRFESRKSTIVRRLNVNHQDDCFLDLSFKKASREGADLFWVDVHGGGHGVPSRVFERKKGATRKLGSLSADFEGAEWSWYFFRAYSNGVRARSDDFLEFLQGLD